MSLIWSGWFISKDLFDLFFNLVGIFSHLQTQCLLPLEEIQCVSAELNFKWPLSLQMCVCDPDFSISISYASFLKIASHTGIQGKNVLISHPVLSQFCATYLSVLCFDLIQAKNGDWCWKILRIHFLPSFLSQSCYHIRLKWLKCRKAFILCYFC